MALAIAISIFFGLVAAISLASVFASLRKATHQARALRAQIMQTGRAAATRSVPLRRPEEAFARALAA